jgi:hypothetical protein
MKNLTCVIAIFFAVCVLSSCATVFGGRVSAYQRTQPVTGQPPRQLRVVALVADIVFFWPGTIIDFATCAIYRPQAPAENTNTSPAVKTAETKASN